MGEVQGLARCQLAKCLQNISFCMCTLAGVFGLIKQPHEKEESSCYHCVCVWTFVFLQCKQGSSVAPGQNFKYTGHTCAKNVYLKNTLRASSMLNKAHVMHTCTQGVKNSQTNTQNDGQIKTDDEIQGTKGGCF